MSLQFKSHNFMEHKQNEKTPFNIKVDTPEEKFVSISTSVLFQNCILTTLLVGMMWLIYNNVSNQKFRPPQTFEEGKQVLGAENVRALESYCVAKLKTIMKTPFRDIDDEKPIIKNYLYDRYLIPKDFYDELIKCDTLEACDAIIKKFNLYDIDKV